MTKRLILAALAVFVAWTALDFLIHGIILRADYEATAELWRPQQEMKTALMHIAGLIFALAFTCIYAWFIGEKNLGTALAYGLVFGVGAGISMGYGTYSVMPVPYKMALVWFLGTLVKTAVGGLLVGLILTRKPASAS